MRLSTSSILRAAILFPTALLRSTADRLRGRPAPSFLGLVLETRIRLLRGDHADALESLRRRLFAGISATELFRRRALVLTRGRARRRAHAGLSPTDFTRNYHPPAMIAEIAAKSKPTLILSHHHTHYWEMSDYLPGLAEDAGSLTCLSVDSHKSGKCVFLDAKNNAHLAFAQLGKALLKKEPVYIAVDGANGATDPLHAPFFGMKRAFMPGFVKIIRTFRPRVVPMFARPGTVLRQFDYFLGEDPFAGVDIGALSDQEILERVLSALEKQVLENGPEYLDVAALY